MKVLKYVFVFLLFCSFCIYARTGTVKFLMGNAEYTVIQDNPVWQKLNINDKVNENIKIRTGKNTKLDIELDNGSVFKLDRATVIELRDLFSDAQAKKNSLKLLTGKLRSIVKKLTATEDDFQVLTPTAVAGVRGTDFGIEQDRGDTEISVFSGRVEVANIDSAEQPVLVEPFQKTEVKSEEKPTQPDIVSQNDLDTWNVKPDEETFASDDYVLHNNLGLVYAEQRYFDKALKEFNTVLKIKPDYAPAYNNMGTVYKDSGDLNNAKLNYELALKYDPNFLEAKINLAICKGLSK